MEYLLSTLTEALDVLLQVALFLLAVDAGQVHAVEPAVLLRLVPVSLQKCHFSHLCFCVYGLTLRRNMIIFTLKNIPR